MPDKVLTVEQVAEHLGVGHQTVRNLIHDGQLPAVRIRGYYRVSEKAFADWIASGGAGSRKPCGKRETSATAQRYADGASSASAVGAGPTK